MLRKLMLHNVGPAEDLEMEELGERLNLITGDNGLGKSFLLEAAWWALTRTWHEYPAVPSAPDAKIVHVYDGVTGKASPKESRWDREGQTWKRKQGHPANPGLVMYARVDGSFSVWDPMRNYRRYTRADGGESESPSAYQFTSQGVLWGLRRDVNVAGVERTETLCRGLIDDWGRWMLSNDPRFDLLKRLLVALGPDDEPLVPGSLLRPFLDDQAEIPTIKMPYGQEVPITYAPAGVKRMAKLAYLLAWSLSEHRTEAERIGKEPSRQIIVLVDELETHLHPRWQRSVLPALIRAVEGWSDDLLPTVQYLIVTHSPLVLASAEPLFDPARDALWKLDLEDGEVRIERDQWRKRGDANRWLKSDVFDLKEAVSREAEAVIVEAGLLLRAAEPDVGQLRALDARILELFSDQDPFFLRWRHYVGPLLGEEET